MVDKATEMTLLDEGAGLASEPVKVTGKGVSKPNTAGLPAIAQHRSRLGKAFISRMRADFQKHGIGVIERVRKERPAAYLELIARLMPQQMEINVQHSFVDVLLEAQKHFDSDKRLIIDPDQDLDRPGRRVIDVDAERVE